MTMSTLTRRQTQIFKFIRDLIKNRGYGPTVREIGDKFKISSPNGVVCHLHALEKKGLINRKANQSRAMTLLVDPYDIDGLPVTGEIFEGELYEPESSERIDFSRFFNDPKCFVLTVEGNSFKDDNITSGDCLVVRKQRTAKRGQTVVVVDDNSKVSLMSWCPEKNRVRLQPTNKRKKAINAKDIAILGLLVGVVRKTA